MRATLRRFSLALCNRRLIFSIVVLFSATVAATSTVSIMVAKAETYCIGADYQNGGGTWVSCGSSAGNFTYHCDGHGNCEAATGEWNQAIADSVCDSHGSNIDPNACSRGYW
jgi:hypothetical protein